MLWNVRTIPGGDQGIHATVAQMRETARSRSLHPLVRHATIQAVRFAPGRDQMVQARLIAGWIEDRAQFMPDPTLAEALYDPLEVLATIAQKGIARVDCDDVAVLTAAMALSIGLHARFVVVGFSPSRAYSHVWAEIRTPSGWLPVDPTRPQHMPALSRSLVVPVS